MPTSIQLNNDAIGQTDTMKPSDEDFLPVQSQKFTYDCGVDPDEGDRSFEINFYSIRRPHMRAFWCSNICNRMSILLWFSVNPVLHEIKKTLSLSKEQIWTSMIATFLGSLVTRLIAGPICDKYGARLPFAIFILATCLPTLSVAFISSSTEFIIVRFFLGIGGGAFVMCHFWLEAMFTKKYSGFLHGFAGGIGGVVGMTQMLIGTIAFPIAASITESTELGWRLSFVPSVVLAIIVAFATILFSDDTPKGNISKLKRDNSIQFKSIKDSFKLATMNKTIWLLACQYACNFGIEIILYSFLGLFFEEEHGLSLLKSSIVVAFAGGSNQVFRMIGGRISDASFDSNGVDGRISWHIRFTFLSGLFFIPFASAEHPIIACLWLSAIMAFLSFAQATTFALLGVVSGSGSCFGIVGAVGNIGAITVAVIFRQLSYKNSFQLVGIMIMFSASLSLLMDFSSYQGIKPSGEKNTYDNSCETTSVTTADIESEGKFENTGKSIGLLDTLYSLEIGQKMSEGWVLVLDSQCPSCFVPLLCAPTKIEPTCIHCGYSLFDSQSQSSFSPPIEI